MSLASLLVFSGSRLTCCMDQLQGLAKHHPEPPAAARTKVKRPAAALLQKLRRTGASNRALRLLC